jgi:voltage-gated potassium channel Kch
MMGVVGSFIFYVFAAAANSSAILIPSTELENRSSLPLLESDDRFGKAPWLHDDAALATHRLDALSGGPRRHSLLHVQKQSFAKDHTADSQLANSRQFVKEQPSGLHQTVDAEVLEQRRRRLPGVVQQSFVLLYTALGAVLPVVKLVRDARGFSRVVVIHAFAMCTCFIGSLYLFTHVIQFSAPLHFAEVRTLNISEAIYFMSVIIGTVGYGDIYPATTHGMVTVTCVTILMVLLYANVVISQVVHLLTKLHIVKEPANHLNMDRGDVESFKTLRFADLESRADSSWHRLYGAFMLNVLINSIGVLFFHFCPGEGKTWAESVHLTVITFTTVGLGDIVPLTEAGQIFAAFWIPFGVTSFTVFVGSFAGLVFSVTRRSGQGINSALEKHAKLQDTKKAFWQLDLANKDADIKNKDGDIKGGKAVEIDRYDFMKFHLLRLNLVNANDIKRIERAFEKSDPGQMTLDKIQKAAFSGECDTPFLDG